LLLLSLLWQIPLRHQLLFMGSRSFIRDPAATSGNGATLPLFRRNVEKDRFDRAVSWLKRSVEQVLVTRGSPYEANQNILYNIRTLFQCEMCPKLAI
jgi:UV radiation resistance-associated gene protein